MSKVYVQNRSRDDVKLLSATGDTVRIPRGVSPIDDAFTVNLPPHVRVVPAPPKRVRRKSYGYEAMEARVEARPAPAPALDHGASDEDGAGANTRRKRGRQEDTDSGTNA